MQRIHTAGEYKNSLKELSTEVYFMGERIDDVVEHPATRPHVNCAAMTYQMAELPEYQPFLTATSHLTGEQINRFTHIHQSAEDLLQKVRMLRLLANTTGSCFQRCVGFDALNALYSVTYEIDQKKGTDYHPRFQSFLQHVQEKNLMCTGAMTDPKGDRGLRPSQQSDPDLYLRVVKEEADGIVVRGAKAHQTGAVNSHEIIVMPTIALRPEDREYAVSFAVPADTPGILYIFGRQSNDERKLAGECIDMGNCNFGLVGGEALVIFEDVFVPRERVFMCGEYDFADLLVERFATHHRLNYGGCKGGVSDVILGAAAAIADYNGVAKASHIRDKLAEIILLTETLYAGSIAAACEGYATPSGAFYPHPLLANAVKQNVTRYIYEVARLAHDIAGGILATLPSEKDLKSPRVGEYIEKYFKGVEGVPTEHRIRIVRLIENMTAGTALAESMHGAGSPQAQRVMLLRQANLEQKKQLARRLAGIN